MSDLVPDGIQYLGQGRWWVVFAGSNGWPTRGVFVEAADLGEAVLRAQAELEVREFVR